MIPEINDPRWKRVLSSDAELAAASLATRILVTRLRREVRAAPAALPQKISELRDFIGKNAFAQADMAQF